MQQAIQALVDETSEGWKALIEQDPELRAELEMVAENLQLKTAQEAFDQVQGFIEDTQKTLGRVKKLWRWARKSHWSRWVAGLTLAFLMFLWWMPDGLRAQLGEWARGIGSYVTAVATILGGLLSAMAPHLKRAHRFLGLAESTKQQVDKAALPQKSVLKAKLTQKVLEFNQSAEILDQKKKEADRIVQQIKDIESGRYLEDFLHERVASKDYAEQLGIIAMVRKDFETLSNRLSKGIEINDDETKDSGELIKIDRIILYIDDLDRCIPKRVVEVLQAVHLLLAIKLFVVVVAVDSRWLLNALRWHYQELFKFGSEILDISKEEEAAWISTPYNYLEKIFQIPFTLRPMTDEGYSKLVKSLFDPIQPDPIPDAGPSSESPAADEMDDSDDTADEEKDKGDGGDEMTAALAEEAGAADNSSAKEKDGTDEAVKDKGDAGAGKEDENGRKKENDGDIENEPDSPKSESPPNLRPEGLTLTEPEKELLGMMGPLVSTPRSAKRMVNVYRLLQYKYCSPFS
jgi:hypothetical protein